RLSFVLLVASLTCLTGCPTPPTREPKSVAPPGPAPAYADLAARYNANIAGLDRLWSRAVVELNWRDDRGKKRFEQGDGNLITGLPDRVALSIGKLGNTLFWAGGDAQRYWLFDLQGDKVAYVGRHAYIGSPCTLESPLAVQPRDLVRLLGIWPV